MTRSLGIGVATFGDDAWKEMGLWAADSLRSQKPKNASVSYASVHSDSLGAARNELVDELDCDYVVLLDADDRLAPGYADAMLKAIGAYGERPGIFRPSTLGVYPDGSEDDEVVMIPRTDMARANCIVIGAAFESTLFWEVGGFDVDLPALEDWHLWCRMIIAGADVVEVPDAIYRVGVNPDSRNSASRQRETNAHGKAYSQIREQFAPYADKLEIR